MDVLRPDTKPYSMQTACRTPIPLLHKVDMDLERMEEHGIIKEIKPTLWCAPKFLVIGGEVEKRRRSVLIFKS